MTTPSPANIAQVLGEICNVSTCTNTLCERIGECQRANSITTPSPDTDAAFEAALPEPYYPQWSHSNEFSAWTKIQVRAIFDAGWAARGEADARVCERQMYSGAFADRSDISVEDYNDGCARCATAIRGMK